MFHDNKDAEKMIFDWIDQIKALMSQEVWDNILLNCSKNEMLVLMLLYRSSDINMSQIADYINAPLNTTTGVVSRMEKKSLVQRVRNEQDKRVVTIVLTEAGSQQINYMLELYMEYGQRIITCLTTEELKMMSQIMTKLVQVFQDINCQPKPKQNRVRKITIE